MKLSITDFSDATRLYKKNEDYFAKCSVEDILANLNNDIIISQRDI
jgi:hypothetical protein